jgi:SNF2 family DNA or RNA helicase
MKKSKANWLPHKYQEESVKFLLEHACAGLFLDPGLGKTSISLAAITVLKNKKMIKKTLIIAPLRVAYQVWRQEATKWLDFEGLTFELLHGPDKDEALRRKADIYIINPEGLDWLFKSEKKKTDSGRTNVKVDIGKFKKLGFDLLLVDELSKFKHTNTNRFKALKKVLPSFSRRWGLTGSPMPNGLLDLFGQAFILDEGHALGQYITHYRNKYFTAIDPQGYKLVVRKGAEKEIYERLKPLALRLSADDHLDLPKKVENNIFIDLPEKVMKVYKSVEAELFAELDEGLIVAANAAGASGKCRQIASGGIYIDDDIDISSNIYKLIKKAKGKDWAELHDMKLEALEDLFEELQGSPILVAYDFKHSLTRLQKKFGKDIPYIGGGVSTARSMELEKQWNNGELPYLFAHPKAVAHGLNLQEAGNHVCWLDPTWDFELYDQFNRRVLRQGNTNKRVFIHHIMARSTVDELIIKAVKSKARNQNNFFEALKSASKSSTISTKNKVKKSDKSCK